MIPRVLLRPDKSLCLKYTPFDLEYCPFISIPVSFDKILSGFCHQELRERMILVNPLKNFRTMGPG